MIELTEIQCRELSRPEPMAFNPQTNEKFVLVPRSVYERLRALVAFEEFDPEETASEVNQIMSDDDAHDPLVESYQHYGFRQ
jgi:hypothetical protein